jgi:hypothetical protein
MVTALKANPKLLAWMPALLVLAACGFVAAGISIINPAHAATATVTVNGTVNSALVFNGGTSCSTATVAAFTTGSEFQNSGACMMEYYSNTTNGANLAIKNNNAGKFFCKGAHVCGGNDEFNDPAAPGALATGDFGVALTGVAGVATSTMTTNPGTAGTGTWYPISSSNQQVCTQGVGTNGTAQCTMRFGGISKATQAQGSYTGTALMTVTDNP